MSDEEKPGGDAPSDGENAAPRPADASKPAKPDAKTATSADSAKADPPPIVAPPHVAPDAVPPVVSSPDGAPTKAAPPTTKKASDAAAPPPSVKAPPPAGEAAKPAIAARLGDGARALKDKAARLTSRTRSKSLRPKKKTAAAPRPKTPAEAADAAVNAAVAGRPASRRARLGPAQAVGHAFALGSVALCGVLAAAFLHYAPRDPIGADLWGVNRLAAVVVKDAKGDTVATRGARYGEAVEVDQLPDYLVKAFLATEDRRFYNHWGVDVKGTMRAAWRNYRSGEVVEGGSTITQQLARNLFLSREQTYDRKIREALTALWLEGHLSKDEILSLYLNRIYLGAGSYGVEAAARTYFGKSARDVTLSEAALLAGLPKAPSTLAPTQNPYGAADRAKKVLNNLLEIKAVTPFAVHEAKVNPPAVKEDSVGAGLGYFFDYVAAQARALAGEAAAYGDVDLIVETTLDMEMQSAAEAAVKTALDYNAKLAGAEEAALVAYAPDGALRAMVGGQSYVESQFNRATQAKRQPGSAFKPFVYVAALEAGVSPSARYVDKPITIGDWTPTNYKNRYLGSMRLTEAMALSVNSIAVRLSERVGRAKVAEVAKRLGVKGDVPAHASIALGGATNLTLEDLTGAYLPLANGGLKTPAYAVTRITDGLGAVLYERPRPTEERVLKRSVVRNMNHLLYQVVDRGTGRRARLGRRTAVGKTGTTNDWRDAWFIGYTRDVVAGVWVGNDAYRPMDEISGGKLPAEIWRDFMLAAHGDLPRRAIPGARPAAVRSNDAALARYYGDVAQGLARVRRDGRQAYR
ncbi:MAG: PBP1A family penicillin-binding protein [Pseudomonadota bacterium]